MLLGQSRRPTWCYISTRAPATASSTAVTVARSYGGPGDDIIVGRDGFNYLYGEAGADYTIGGGSGLDIVSYQDSPSGVVADPDWTFGDDGAPDEGEQFGGDVEGTG